MRTPAFDSRLDDLFAAALEPSADHMAANPARLEIGRATRLYTPDGTIPAEVLLHVRGDRAWWRWEDEPFEDDD